MNFELDKMTVPEILSLIERAKQEIEHRKVTAKDRLKQEIEDRLRETGLDLTDLFPETGKRTKNSRKTGENTPVPVKYRDPVSQGTWSGRGGRPPQWVKSIMMERRWSLEQFKASGEYEV